MEAMSNVVATAEAFYLAVGAACPLSERVVFALAIWACHVLSFWIPTLIVSFLDLYQLCPQWKIQKGKAPDKALVVSALKHVLLNQFVVQPVVAYWLLFPIWKHFGGETWAAWPSLQTVLVTLLVAVFVNDTGFYWAHRLLHHRAIYKYIHKKHHEFKVTVGFAAEYANPIEDVLANLLPTLAGPIGMGSHLVVLVLWLHIRVLETVAAHCGYSFPFVVFEGWFGLGGAERHDFHHSHNAGCYGSFFIFWDFLLGTDKAFLAWKASSGKSE